MGILKPSDGLSENVYPGGIPVTPRTLQPKRPKLRMSLALMGVLNLSPMLGCSTPDNQNYNCAPSEGQSAENGFEPSINNKMLRVTHHPNIETGNGLKIRQTADLEGVTIGRLHPGDVVLVKKSTPVCNTQGDVIWMGEVETENGTTGWVIISTINYATGKREYYLSIPEVK